MSTETDLFTALKDDSGVSAIVGTRIYPGVLPDTHDLADPAIAYREVSGVRIGGVCVQRRMQVDCYADSYSELKGLRDAVKALADGNINWQYVEGPDLYEEDTRLHHQPLDLIIS